MNGQNGGRTDEQTKALSLKCEGASINRMERKLMKKLVVLQVPVEVKGHVRRQIKMLTIREKY